MERLADGLLWYVAFLFLTTLHEASLAFAAFGRGDRTACNVSDPLHLAFVNLLFYPDAHYQ